MSRQGLVVAPFFYPPRSLAGIPCVSVRKTTVASRLPFRRGLSGQIEALILDPTRLERPFWSRARALEVGVGPQPARICLFNFREAAGRKRPCTHAQKNQRATNLRNLQSARVQPPCGSCAGSLAANAAFDSTDAAVRESVSCAARRATDVVLQTALWRSGANS